MKKVSDPILAHQLEQIPNIGPSIADDLRLIGLKTPGTLINKDPYDLYMKLCKKTKAYHDPCLLDTFIAATRFMNGEGNKSWWAYTEERKENWEKVRAKVEKFK